MKKKKPATRELQNRGAPIAPTTQSAPAHTRFQAIQASTFSGPLPPPELLKQYDEIMPDGANRIVTMAENQSAHRIELEKIVIRGDDRRANWGVVCGFSLGTIIVALSFILILYGHDAAGATLGTADLVALVGTFIYGTRARKLERERRNQQNKALTQREQ